MTAAAGQARLPRAAVEAKLRELVLVACVAVAVLLSGFVVREPAPYELFLALALPLWFLFGMRLSRGIAPLVTLQALFAIGGLIAMTQMRELHDTPLYLAVTLFLGLTSVFYAAVIERLPRLLDVIFGTWVLAALGTSLAGIAGYFDLLPGASLFTRYGRAAGAFEDPNVFGPYLVAPGLWLLHGLITAPARRAVPCGLLLLPLLGGLFLSFSRGAWGLLLASGMLMVLCLLLGNRSTTLRLRILALTAIAVALATIATIALLQIPEVYEVFAERARLLQEYDSGRLGRFARYAVGFEMAMEHPLGIGALEFGRRLGEDTHNIWLKALLDYSWLGFAAFLILTLWTLAAGLRILFRHRPWQPALLCAWSAFAGHILLGTVIDIDHWRHFYLLMGVVWGCILLEQRRARSAAKIPAGRPHEGLAPATRIL